MMDQLPYLRIRYQRHGRPCGVTLSLPSSLERALKLGRLPGDAEALLGDAETWVPLMLHPAAEQLLAAAAPGSDEVVLFDPEQLTQSEEYARFLAASVGQDRRVSSQPSRTDVTGSAKGIWRRRFDAVHRWAAAL